MEREPGREGTDADETAQLPVADGSGPIWQVTPRLLAVTLGATALAAGYGLLLWWANPSSDTQFLVIAGAPLLGGWIIGLLQPRRLLIGVGIGMLLAATGILLVAIGFAPSMRYWAYADIVPDTLLCALVGAGVAAGLSRFRYARAARPLLTVVLCLGLAALAARAFEDFRLPAMRAVAAPDWPADALLATVGVTPPASARWTAGRYDYQWDEGVVFSRSWRADVAGVGKGRWQVRMSAENKGARRAWRLASFAILLEWWCSDRAAKPIATEDDVRRTVRALAPDLQITKAEVRGRAYSLTAEPCGVWKLTSVDWVPRYGLLRIDGAIPGPAPH